MGSRRRAVKKILAVCGSVQRLIHSGKDPSPLDSDVSMRQASRAVSFQMLAPSPPLVVSRQRQYFTDPYRQIVRTVLVAPTHEEIIADQIRH